MQSHLKGRPSRAVGSALLGASAAAAVAAWVHMRATLGLYGVICGSPGGPAAHCPACYVSTLLFVAGLAALLRPARAKAPVYGRS